MVGADPADAAVEAGGQVADHPPVGVLVGVGPDVDAGADLGHRPLEQAGHAQRVDQTGERPLGIGHRHRGLQQPQPGQRGEGCAAAGRPQAGRGLVAGQRAVRGRAQQAGHPVIAVARAQQGGAQGGHVVGSQQVHGTPP